MIDYLRTLQSKYRHSGVILDANLFLLLLVGAYEPEKISEYKITQFYTQDDFDLLVQLLVRFKIIVTTPSILAEVSNHSGNQDGRFDSIYFDLFINRIQICEEVYPRSKDFIEQVTFRRFGLTDAGIIDAARRGKYLILTDDLPLTAHGLELGIDILNFTSLREYRKYLL